MRVLSLTPEMFPLIKTGGLADVAGALPLALAPLGCEVRTLLPGYPGVLSKLPAAEAFAEIDDLMGGPARLLAGRTAEGAEVILLDAPHLYGRLGNPYLGPDGRDWPDNFRRFGALSKVGAEIARGMVGDWPADILHAHDWQAGLAPAYLKLADEPGPRSVLTVHNLAFQGWFEAIWMTELGLPLAGFRTEGFEYFKGIGFLKAGLYYADRLTTVSPTYAKEIQTPEQGMALDGLLRTRARDLVGIANGIDAEVWNPATDAFLAAAYPPDVPAGKAVNKAALQARFALRLDPAAPLFAVVSRLTDQKGMDLLLACLPGLVALGGQLVVLGSGEPALEAGFRAAVREHAGRVGCILGYDEPLSHLIQAGADLIVVPSRFEPCGLTQLIGLRYGTIPLVARVGGLADTVIDANEAALLDGVATGFHVAPVTAPALNDAISRAVQAYRDEATWSAMVERAMSRRVGWDRAAQRYLAVYRDALAGRPEAYSVEVTPPST